MSLAQPLRCAFSASRAFRAPTTTSRLFHSVPARYGREHTRNRRPPPPASEASAQEKRDFMKPYTAEERKTVEQKYTPEQLEVLELGEQAIDPADVYDQGALRRDPMAIDYVEDFSQIRPYIDHPPRPETEEFDPDTRLATDAEITQDLWDYAKTRLPEPFNPWEMADSVQLTRGAAKGDGRPEGSSYAQPGLPKFEDPMMRRAARAAHVGSNSAAAEVRKELAKQTGMSDMKLRGLRVKRLVVNRVSNQTRMGKIGKMYVLTIAGDRNGLLGIGEGNAVDMEAASAKSRRNAIRNMVPVPRYEDRTIFGDVKGKVGATELELFTRPPGFGLRCQEKILEMCKCAGISDLSARVTRARNPMNTVKAAFQALMKQRDPEQVARARGRKMVDVRRVYYAGNT